MTQPTPTSGVPYQEVTDPRFAAEAAASFVVEDHGDGVQLLRGPCPRCRIHIDVPVVPEIVRTYRPEADVGGGMPDGTVEPVICTCTEPHDGRPEGRVGCGAYWNFIL